MTGYTRHDVISDPRYTMHLAEDSTPKPAPELDVRAVLDRLRPTLLANRQEHSA